MLNQIVIVGRLKSIEDLKKNVLLTIAVSRVFKNKDGEYETDLIPVLLEGNLMKNTLGNISLEDLIGIKGRLQKNEELVVMAEKITYLTSKKTEEENK